MWANVSAAWNDWETVLTGLTDLNDLGLTLAIITFLNLCVAVFGFKVDHGYAAVQNNKVLLESPAQIGNDGV